MTEPTPDTVDQIIDLTLQIQTYLAADPDLRATDLLAAAIEIIDALLEHLFALDEQLDAALAGGDCPAVH